MLDIALVGHGGSAWPRPNLDARGRRADPEARTGVRPARGDRHRRVLDDPAQQDVERWTGALQQNDGIRWNRVQAVREAIRDGHYITHDRLDQAVEGLLDDLAN